MRKIIVLVVILIVALVIAFIVYTFVRDLIFPEIGIYKVNTTGYLAFYYRWKDTHPNASDDEFPIYDALLDILYTRYPSWSEEKRQEFIEKHKITNCLELAYEIARFELPPRLFERYKQRYGSRENGSLE